MKLNNIKFKMIKRLGSLMLAFALAAAMFPMSGAAESYPEYLRIGLFYGDTEVPSASVSADNGFNLGYYSDRTFNPVCTAASPITVQRDDMAGYPYHLRYASGLSAEAAQSLAAQLSGEGIMAYPAYINGEIGVWGGMYASVADAEAAAAADAHAPMPMDMSGDRICVLDASGKIIFLFGSGGTGLGVRPIFSDPMGEKLTVSGSTYRGGLDFRRLSGGAMTVVNVVKTEHYLYGVISREMSTSWHIEALKAQAVCARTYAFSSLGKHDAYGFDLCPTTDCQAYSGVEREDGNSYAPVDQTAGMVLKYDGALAQTVYCSSTGPNTESVEYVWGTPYPYLVSVDNSYENTSEIPNGVWSSTVTADQMTQIMNNAGRGVGQVTNIDVLERTPAGRVMRLRIAGTAGETVLEREECRSVLSDIVKSRLYTVKGNADPASSSNTVSNTLCVWDGMVYRELSANEVYIIGGDLTIVQQAALYILGADGARRLGGELKEEIKEEISTAPSTEWEFSGMGWGHAVGMSQYGAKGMAEAGIGFEDILTHYFTGTYLEKVY